MNNIFIKFIGSIWLFLQLFFSKIKVKSNSIDLSKCKIKYNHIKSNIVFLNWFDSYCDSILFFNPNHEQPYW